MKKTFNESGTNSALNKTTIDNIIDESKKYQQDNNLQGNVYL